MQQCAPLIDSARSSTEATDPPAPSGCFLRAKERSKFLLGVRDDRAVPPFTFTSS